MPSPAGSAGALPPGLVHKKPAAAAQNFLLVYFLVQSIFIMFSSFLFRIINRRLRNAGTRINTGFFLPQNKTTPHKQLSLADIFTDCQNKFDNDKYEFLELLDNAINLDEIVPASFVPHFQGRRVGVAGIAPVNSGFFIFSAEVFV